MQQAIHKAVIFLSILFSPLLLWAQPAKDSVNTLQEVVVTAMQGATNWKDVPAAIAIIGKTETQRNATASLLSLFNSVPGVRMEERSPGSYRLSIRGSLLRSPFGVRNLKVYYNGLPLSDASGNTYLNLLNTEQVSGAEILKGPAASMYGAGTGGAILLWSDTAYAAMPLFQYKGGIQVGSYGLLQQQAGITYSNQGFQSTLQQQHLQSSGYRRQSSLRRDGLQWTAGWRKGRHDTRLISFYTDLQYQTPGGLTALQMQQDPASARPATASLPGAVQQKAAVYNQTLYAGIIHKYRINAKQDLHAFVMTSNTRFRNPFITNYEKRNEHNAGMGIGWTNRFSKGIHQWVLHLGTEWLTQGAHIDNYGNRNGIKDTIQYKDRVRSTQWMGYAQLTWRVGERIIIQSGISLNTQSYRYERLVNPVQPIQKRTMGELLAPRLSLAYRVSRDITLYGVVAKGFSAPTLAEFRPSDGNFYPFLEAERGWNMEAGIKGYLLHGRLNVDLSAYYFALKNAIVRRNDNSGNEYFVNAGATSQPGIELNTRLKLFKAIDRWRPAMFLWTSMAWQPYRFTEYRQGAISYDQNQLTGVPRILWVTGVDLEAANGVYLAVSLDHTGRIYLNDANDEFASPRSILQARAGYRKGVVDFFLTLDNGLNQSYSLGHDINALGRRYYNPAMPRNWSVGAFFRF